MKTSSAVSIIAVFVIALTVLSGCGQTQNNPTPTPTPTTTITLSGSLYSGTIRTSGVQTASGLSLADANTPIKDYQVAAIGTTDNKMYFPDSKTDASGNFSMSVPNGQSYYVEVINDSKKYAAPVTFGASGSNVVMAITPEATSETLDLGKVVYESSKGAAVPETAPPSAELDSNSLAKKKTGEAYVPVGAGNLGRGEGEAAYSGDLKDAVDEDMDGLPDVVDIDDNGNGTVDGLDPNPRRSGAVETQLTGIDHTNAFSNLPLQYENYPTYKNGALNTDSIDIGANTNFAIEAIMTSGTNPTTFSEIKLADGPAWLDTATISSGTNAGILWKNNSYKLEKGSDRWDIHVTPNATPAAGDALKFQATDTSSNVQTYLSTITYVFNNAPKLIKYSYTDGSVVTKEGASDLDLTVYQTNSNTFPYKGSTITFTWTAPKDDRGNKVTAVTWYLDGINYTRADGTNFTSGSTSIQITPSSSTDATFGTVYTYTFTPTTDTFSYFKVDIKAQSPASGGGNASQMVKFKKTG